MVDRGEIGYFIGWRHGRRPRGQFRGRRLGRSQLSRPRPSATPPSTSWILGRHDRHPEPPPPRSAGPHLRPHSGSLTAAAAALELAGLLLATAVLYLWNLGASGWANAFYSAAAQAGSQDWTAWFFGSSDAANAITVDKPPASLWVMGLSVRIFGLSSWSVLVPQALMGVGTVWLVYLAVRRAACPATAAPAWPALLAGAVMALTPVAVLMFRFNNPDALLVLLMTAAAYAVLRSIQDARLRGSCWPACSWASGSSPSSCRSCWSCLAVRSGVPHRRTGGARQARSLHLPSRAPRWSWRPAGGWPSSNSSPPRAGPYIGGSQSNSILELTLGYNGLGRLNGDETGSVGGGNDWGTAGLCRLFNSEFGGQIAGFCRRSLLARQRRLLWLRPAGAAHGRRPGVGDRLGHLGAGHRPDVQLHGRASSTRTTWWRWPPGSRAGRRSAASCSGSGGTGPWRPRSRCVDCGGRGSWPPNSSAGSATSPVAALGRAPRLSLAAAGLVLAAAAPARSRCRSCKDSGVRESGAHTSESDGADDGGTRRHRPPSPAPLAYSLTTAATAPAARIVSAGPRVRPAADPAMPGLGAASGLAATAGPARRAGWAGSSGPARRRRHW